MPIANATTAVIAVSRSFPMTASANGTSSAALATMTPEPVIETSAIVIANCSDERDPETGGGRGAHVPSAAMLVGKPAVGRQTACAH